MTSYAVHLCVMLLHLSYTITSGPCQLHGSLVECNLFQKLQWNAKSFTFSEVNVDTLSTKKIYLKISIYVNISCGNIAATIWVQYVEEIKFQHKTIIYGIILCVTHQIPCVDAQKMYFQCIYIWTVNNHLKKNILNLDFSVLIIVYGPILYLFR